MVKQTAGRTILGNFAPKFAALNDDVLFGEVWSREGKLPLKIRSIVTVSALIGKGMTDASLAYHLKEAKKNGVTQEEMAELLTHIAFTRVGLMHGRPSILPWKSMRMGTRSTAASLGRASRIRLTRSISPGIPI